MSKNLDLEEMASRTREEHDCFTDSKGSTF